MIKITPTVLAACQREAVRAYPSEGCGFLLGPQTGIADELIAVENIQDKLHAKDPERFSRTAATAYSIDPKVQEAVFARAKAEGREVTGIFHSHPDHGAYFSPEDRTNAAPWGEPLLPGLAYIVVSVYNGEVKAMRQFYWDDSTSDFSDADV